jgi:ketosteroid isomerase-like protein
MAYDEELAHRVRELLADEDGLSEMSMFGGLAFLLRGNMSVAASGQGGLLVRVDPVAGEQLLSPPHVEPMEMRGRKMTGWLRVDADSVKTTGRRATAARPNVARAIDLVVSLLEPSKGATVPLRERQSQSSRLPIVAVGALGAFAARSLFRRALLFKLNRDVRALNTGDYQPLLAGYADDAVLVFNDGAHRWAGVHRGKPALERFFKDFVGARVQGEIVDLFVAGPPWALTLLVRFDDHAHSEHGDELYRNRTLLLARARWGKIVKQEDFYEDTERIAELDRRLTELGVAPAVEQAVPA